MKKRNLKADSSGQAIIITALLITSLLLSTAIYVIETEKETPVVGTDQNTVIQSYQQSIRNTLISALGKLNQRG